MADDIALASWRDSARSVKFFFLPGQSVFPIFLWIFFPHWATFFVLLGVVVFLAVIMRFGFSIRVFSRILKCFFAGDVVASKPWWEQ